jgi:cyclic pyranopterin phosphate synthase
MLMDRHGRKISTLRVSVTDRCNLRCRYCLAEDHEFLPRQDLLSLEEMARVCRAFVARGVRKIRLTGGEPLVRRNVISLVTDLGALIGPGGLDELTLTTNGTQLGRFASLLAQAGMRRVNVSLDTLDPARFSRLTRGGRVETVIDGILAARAAGLAVKVNAVAMQEQSLQDWDRLIRWCGNLGLDLCLIEAMPMGGGGTPGSRLSLARLRADLERRWTLTDSPHRTSGPARYVEVAETGRRIGFITPLSHGFCATCDRMRLTCTGMAYPCLGRDDGFDLGAALRADRTGSLLDDAIDGAVAGKAQGHDFAHLRQSRPMSMTGG